MIQSRCRLLRVQRFEDQAYEEILIEPGSAADPDARILAAISQSGNALDKLQRYRAAADRSYYKALRELQASRSRLQKAEKTALENYITKVVFAPVPGHHERKAYHGAVNAFTQGTGQITKRSQFVRREDHGGRPRQPRPPPLTRRRPFQSD